MRHLKIIFQSTAGRCQISNVLPRPEITIQKMKIKAIESDIL
jgi:hypothetical protein